MSEENSWERQALEHLLLENLKESKRARRWRTFWRILFTFVMLGIIVLMFQASNVGKSGVLGKHTALITIDGPISPTTPANATDVNASLKAAFENPESVGVIVRIDSPGGSPVQAGMIHDEILRLRKLYPNKPLHVVVEEVCASGGYYIAVAGEKIYVDKASLVGSIGVIMQGFGLTGLMDKLGIESRTITAGENKAMLDPFKKESPQQRAKLQALLDEIHAQFIQVVKEGRGDRLKNDPDLFSGMIWNGSRSIELGLTDAIGTVDSVARDVFKQPDVVDYTLHENLAERVAKKFGAAAGTSFGKVISEQTRIQ